jgi:hypothetical protein
MSSAEVYRYERKYLVPERIAVGVRRFVEGYLEHDKHMAGQGPDGYRVCSLYLDTPQLGLYHQSCNGHKNRYKLRIRYYDDFELSPAFLEIKKRTTDTVHKLRAIVPKVAAAKMLRGGYLSHNDLLASDDASHRALEEFRQSFERSNMLGVAFVDYRREAFVSRTAESVRVTFDRHVTGLKYYPGCGLRTPEDRSRAVTRGVVLELKYNGRAPRWMHDLVTTFGLERQPFAKYVLCVDALQIDPNYAGVVVRR